MPLPLIDLAIIIKAEHQKPISDQNLSEIVKLSNEIQQFVFDNALNNTIVRDDESSDEDRSGGIDNNLNWSGNSTPRNQNSSSKHNSQGGHGRNSSSSVAVSDHHHPAMVKQKSVPNNPMSGVSGPNSATPRKMPPREKN